LTDVTINAPVLDATAELLSPTIVTGSGINIAVPILDATAEFLSPDVQAFTPSFFFETADGIILRELSFESLYPGKKSDVQKITVINNLDTQIDMTLTPTVSTSQLGSDLDTYLSHYLSLDNVSFSTNPLELTIPGSSELDFYTYYHPPSTAGIGWKQWLMDVEIDIPSLEGWSYTTYFIVTPEGDAITIPYTLERLVKIEYIPGLMKYDFGDVRFALADHTILKHYVVSKVDNDEAYFLVQLPSVVASPDTFEVYVYTGNQDAEDVSDPSILQIHDHFPSTELNPALWIVNAITGGSITYSVNDYLRITDCFGGNQGSRWALNGQISDTGSQHQLKWTPTSSFNIEYQMTISKSSNQTGQCGIGLLRSDGTIILWFGVYDFGPWGDITLNGVNTEGSWSNFATGWHFPYYGFAPLGVKTSTFNIERDGTNVSVYVDGVRIADTSITSAVNKLAVVVGKTVTYNFFDYVQFDYIALEEYNMESPSVGSINTAWINTYPIPVQADVLYQPRDLPELDVERRYGVRIGGTLFE
jgi:hypothetical protein